MKVSMALSILLACPIILSANNDQNSPVNLKTSKIEEVADLDITEKTGSYTTSQMTTATGLELSIRQTPQSVSVVSNKLIKDLALNEVSDALGYSTGVYVNSELGRKNMQIRGFNIDNVQEDGVASSVATSLQGDLGYSKEMSSLIFYDRIEVLRGVAGLTQSNSEPSGTINLIRKKPTKEFQGSGSLSAASWSNYGGNFDISDSLNSSKTIRARFIGSLNKTGSFKDTISGRKEAAGVMFGFDIGDNSVLNAGTIYQKTTGVYDVYGIPSVDGNGNLLNLDRKSYFGADWSQDNYQKINTFADLTHFFSDDWSLSGKINYTKSEGNFKFGQLWGVNPYGSRTHFIRRQKFENSGNEINFKLDLVGKYELLNQNHDFFTNAGISKEKFTTQSKWGRNLQGYSIYDFDAKSIPEPNWDLNSNLILNNKSLTTIYQQSVTSGTRINFTDNLHLLAGVRFSRVKRESASENLLINVSTNNQIMTKSKFTPYAGLTWDFAQNHSFYISYAEIFKPQPVKSKDGNYIEPLVGSSYETGIKSEFFDKRLNTAIALFRIEQENRATSDIADPTSFFADGRVRSEGLDIEISGEISKNWQIFAGYTLNKSKYVKSEITSRDTDTTKGALANAYTPRHIFRLYTSYQVPTFEALRVSTGVRYQSKTSSKYKKTLALTPPDQEAYALWDANINYKINKNFDIGFNVKNITDKRYFLNTSTRVAGGRNYYGDPRNFTLTINYTY